MSQSVTHHAARMDCGAKAQKPSQTMPLTEVVSRLCRAFPDFATSRRRPGLRAERAFSARSQASCHADSVQSCKTFPARPCRHCLSCQPAGPCARRCHFSSCLHPIVVILGLPSARKMLENVANGVRRRPQLAWPSHACIQRWFRLASRVTKIGRAHV